MLIFALALTATEPMPLTDVHQSAISCVVDVAVLAEEQKGSAAPDGDLAKNGKRWAGLVGTRIMEETGQPREVVAFAMMEAAKARSKAASGNDVAACIRQMQADLAVADAAAKPLPKPVKAQ